MLTCLTTLIMAYLICVHINYQLHGTKYNFEYEKKTCTTQHNYKC